VDGTPLIFRDDDREEVIQGRISAYERQTKPLVEYFREQGRLVPVNADRELPQVTAEIFGVIDDHRKKCELAAMKTGSAPRQSN
jgi:adenylate kinase